MSGERPEDDVFIAPLPPPPPGVPEHDVVFSRHSAPPPEAPTPEGRDHEDIMLRRVPADRARKFRAAAGGRGLTHGQYLAALVALHEAMRRRADEGDEALAAEL